MQNPNAIVSSVRTDNDRTTLTSSSSTDDDDNNVEGAFEFGVSRFSTSHSGGYQSLPQTSTSNFLFKGKHNRRSSAMLSLRGSKTSLDNVSNVSEKRPLTMERLEYFGSVVNQICIGFVTIYMSWLCLRTGLAGTALHAWLATIGFSLLMAEGIMCHYNGNVLTFSYKRSTKTTIHWILQALGGGLGVAGSLVKLIQKGFLLQSTHGKLGFAACILCLISMSNGVFALFSMRFKKILSPLLNKTFHNVLGIATFAIALLAQFYGYQTGYFRFKAKVSLDFQIMMKCITLVSLLLTCIGPLKALYQKMCNIYKNFN